MSKIYERLDALIVDAIMAHKSPIYERLCVRESDRIGQLSGRQGYRVVDGRLQALRKRGVIEYRNKKNGGPGWFVCMEAKCGE